jgi:2,3,4,5-tetrahydropyridine-2-carboxylate N-succinyltransferase
MQELESKIFVLKDKIESIWEDKDHNLDQSKAVVREVIELLDSGVIRVSNKIGDQWVVNLWLKKAILLSFRYNDSKLMSYGGNNFFDKVDLKFSTWGEEQFKSASIRAIPGSVVRKSAYIGRNTILLPSFVNVGAYVDDGTMVDTWATIGSCAQIGKNCHISGGAGIGGVLEPMQANPVIIEDNCFIGARSEVAEGVIIREGSVLSMGVFIGQSTRIYDREADKILYGEVPPYSVVVPGTLPSNGANLYAAIIVKKVDEKTRSKVSLNELLRD